MLVEVSNSRLRADTLIIGDNERAEGDLDRMITKKIGQLDACIVALISGDAKIPDVEMSHVRRIWPVLVTAGEITQTEELWQFIAEKAVEDERALLDQAKVQPLTLLGVDDYDQLCGLIEAGHSPPDLLAAKTQPAYRYLELAVWLNHDPSAPIVDRPPKMVDDAFHRTTDRMIKTIDFTRGVQPEITKAPEADEVRTGELES